MNPYHRDAMRRTQLAASLGWKVRQRQRRRYYVRGSVWVRVGCRLADDMPTLSRWLDRHAADIACALTLHTLDNLDREGNQPCVQS